MNPKPTPPTRPPPRPLRPSCALEAFLLRLEDGDLNGPSPLRTSPAFQRPDLVSMAETVVQLRVALDHRLVSMAETIAVAADVGAIAQRQPGLMAEITVRPG